LRIKKKLLQAIFQRKKYKKNRKIRIEIRSRDKNSSFFLSKISREEGTLFVLLGFYGVPLGLPHPLIDPLGSLRSITVPDPTRRREMAESWIARWEGWISSSLSLIFSIFSSLLLSGLSLNWQRSWSCTYFF